jgi:ubiquinone/menaquinone biosynthesis C-methylase UbiE
VRSVLGPAAGNLLDLGAGTGRLGRAFVGARDPYVGVDRSFAMLEQFRRTAQETNRSPPCLLQADGSFLPFRDRAFRGVLLAHVLSTSPSWSKLLAEATRVLGPGGVLFLAQRIGPPEGLDAQMRKQLRTILASLDVEVPDPGQVKTDARAWLQSVAVSCQHLVAARWELDSSPRDFLDRHATGARFAALPPEIRMLSMRRLGEWAVTTFGALDTWFAEEHRLEVDAFRFGGIDRDRVGEARG